MAESRQHGKQGFASMDPERARAIQSMGGHASHGASSEAHREPVSGRKGGSTQKASGSQQSRAGRQSHKNS
jgi:general stress protein YciG